MDCPYDFVCGQGLWQTPAVPFCTPAPWGGLSNFRVLSLGPVTSGGKPVWVVLGGKKGDQYRNDVWRSLDGGQTWEEISAHEEARTNASGYAVRKKWAGRQGFATAGSWKLKDGRCQTLIYVVGGLGVRSPPFSDVWASEDLGRNFTRMCASAPFGPRVSSGLAACPGMPSRLVLVGGGWNDDVDRWDCWLSDDAGANWEEIPTPANSVQRRMPVLTFTRAGTLVVLGGHNRHEPSRDAHAAKLRWKTRVATWQRLNVHMDGVALEDLDRAELPFFFNHSTVIDLRDGEVVGLVNDMGRLASTGSGGQLAVCRLPLSVLRGCFPLPEGDLSLNISLKPRRIPSDIRVCKLGDMSLQMLLPVDALRVFIFTHTGDIWVTGGRDSVHLGLRRQANMLQRIGSQLQESWGIPSEVWARVLLAMFGAGVTTVLAKA